MWIAYCTNHTPTLHSSKGTSLFTNPITTINPSVSLYFSTNFLFGWGPHLVKAQVNIAILEQADWDVHIYCIFFYCSHIFDDVAIWKILCQNPQKITMVKMVLITIVFLGLLLTNVHITTGGLTLHKKSCARRAWQWFGFFLGFAETLRCGLLFSHS